MQRTISRRTALAWGATTLAVGELIGAAERVGAQTPRRDTRETERRMKLGLVSYNVAKDWDRATVLKNCREAGIEGFEARTTHAHGIEPGLTAAQRATVKKQFADAGVTLWGLGTVCEFHAADPAVVRKNIEDCRVWAQLARDVGAHGVKVRPNGLRRDVPAERTLDQIAAALKQCGAAADEQGVEIWVEVHGSETQKPENIQTILERCGHPRVGACWNSNRTDVENGSVRAAFARLKPYLRSCHINDLWGDYPYGELFALFREAGYDRFTLCEVGTPIAADSGATFLRCYRGLWKALQSQRAE